MSEQWIDRELKTALRGREETVPAEVDRRMEAALAALLGADAARGRKEDRIAPMRVRSRRGARWMGRTALAAVAAIVLISAAACVIPGTRAQILASPIVKKAVQGIPLLGSLLDMSSDEGLRKAQELGYVTNANVAATDQGITLLIREVAYDGNRFVISYEAQSLQRVFAPKPILTVNGKELEGSYSSGELEQGGTGVGAGVVRMTPNGSGKLPDSFTLGIRYNEVYVRKSDEKSIGQPLAGTWSFEVPVRKANVGEKQWIFETPPAYREGGIELAIHSVTSSRTSTAIELETELPKAYLKPGYLIDWQAFDDGGKPIGMVGSGSKDGKLLIDDTNRIRTISTMLFQPTESSEIKLVCIVRELKELKPGEWKETGTKEVPVIIKLQR